MEADQYQARLITFLTEGDFHTDFNENGSMTKCSLYPLELFINLSVELAKREFINGTREQLEWAINYLEANYQSNFADNTEHGSIDWM
eukprot:SAG22_NODE_3232_length_1842_cov_4.887550_3_plen_87_part_01